MGILDKNSRVVDSILTIEGRRQLSDGNLDISFYAFEDSDVIYSDDGTGVLADASSRISFEAWQKQQDTIVVRSDESGNVLASISGSVIISGGRAFANTGSTVVAATQNDHDRMIASVDPTNSLRYQSLLQTVDSFSDNEFEVAPSQLTFTLTNNIPLEKRQQVGEINGADPLYSDPLLSHIINFAYLPPVNAAGESLGQYQPIGSIKPISTAEHLKKIDDCQRISVYMAPRPLNNRIALQMFAFHSSDVIKLHAIDAGYIGTSRVVFYGRVLKNSNGALVFLRIFTVLIDK